MGLIVAPRSLAQGGGALPPWFVRWWQMPKRATRRPALCHIRLFKVSCQSCTELRDLWSLDIHTLHFDLKVTCANVTDRTQVPIDNTAAGPPTVRLLHLRPWPSLWRSRGHIQPLPPFSDFRGQLRLAACGLMVYGVFLVASKPVTENSRAPTFMKGGENHLAGSHW